MSFNIAIVCDKLSLRKQLLNALKHYPKPNDICYYIEGLKAFVHDQAKLEIAPWQAVKDISEIPESGIDVYVYAALEDYQSRKTGHTIYLGKSYSFCKTAHDMPLPAPKWLNLKHYAPAHISDNCDSTDQKVFASVSEYLKKSTRFEVLVEDHQELLETLLFANPGSFCVYHPDEPVPSLNLNLDCFDSQSSFSQILHQLSSLEKSLKYSKSMDISITPESNASKQSYMLFAQHYDKYMSHVSYDIWIAKLLTWQRQYSKLKLDRVLELACGTANIAAGLVEMGYEVFASDSSLYMLDVADKKLYKPQLFHADLQDPLPLENLDLAFCLFDSINYLPHLNALHRCLQNVYQALKPGGIFIFDISTLGNSMENFYDLTQVTKSGGSYIVQEAGFDEEKYLQQSKLTIFNKQGISYQKQEEVHLQKVFLHHELLELFKVVSLSPIAVHALEEEQNLLGSRLRKIDTKYTRLFYILRKD